ncbi:RNA polymerase sigma factor [Leptospira levettii]|uniref:RNA polymerase sigma factor n=1 Tax=Leptospira levettii TaxID=2023178 RepID=UPI001083414A|nr:sigma-70 family RNA polymerase sigma factor [Leptospira levettii]MCW7509376.1 sigma-70 family RNA polymerase sigma factor [Leptospira levettii]MCW7520465.1 sigma-70 family RNA polymerase sigma factor [Leptospira levettii]TGK97294.1 sigma-70 family RNA polymerase sigma factor [Leptospira levettii]TGL15774.1 sigma-70 family RNA polymerase sigma factor [Leptospira levettii]
MSDEIRSLIDNCLLGKREAWQTLIQKFHRLIIGTCAHYVPREEVVDTSQLVYLKLTENDYQLLRKFKGESLPAFIIYLNEIAKNISMSQTRSIRRTEYREGISLDLSIDILDERLTQEDVYFEWEEKKEFYDLIETLDEPHKEILILRLKGYKFKEIAAILEVPIGTVLARANRAKEKIKKLQTKEIKP